MCWGLRMGLLGPSDDTLKVILLYSLGASAFSHSAKIRSSDQRGRILLSIPSCFSGYSDQFLFKGALDRKQSTPLSSKMSRNYPNWWYMIYMTHIFDYMYIQNNSILRKRLSFSPSRHIKENSKIWKTLKQIVNNSPGDQFMSAQYFYLYAWYLGCGFILSENISAVILIPGMNEFENTMFTQVTLCSQNNQIKVGALIVVYGMPLKVVTV